MSSHTSLYRPRHRGVTAAPQGLTDDSTSQPPANATADDAAATEVSTQPASHEPRRGLAIASAVMAAGTTVSRVLGFIRTALIGIALGSTAVMADVFERANSIPNIIYLLLAGGMFNVVLVPQLIKAAKAPDRGADYASRLLTLTVTVLAAATLLITVAAYPLMVSLTRGWTEPMIAVGTAFALWTLPQIFFYGLYAVIGQILNANAKFGWYMWAPVLNNVIAITVLISYIATFGAYASDTDQLTEWTTQQTVWLAGGHTVGIIAQALILLWPLSKLGLKLRPRFGIRGMGLGRTGSIAGLTLLTMLIGNIANLLYMRLVSEAAAARRSIPDGASVPGEYAANIAELMVLLPHSVFVLSIATVLFNQLSHSLSLGKINNARDLLHRGLRIFSVPVMFFMVAIIVLAGPLGRIFGGSGPEAQAAGAAIAQLLLLHALGMPFRSANFYLIRAFYAAENAKTPLLVFGIAAAVGLTVTYTAAIFVDGRYIPYLVVGMFSVLHILQYILCHIFAVRRWGSFGFVGVLMSYVRSGFAAVLAGAVGAVVLGLLGGYSYGFAWDSIITAVISCAIVGTVMAGAFVIGLKLFNSSELRMFAEPLARRIPLLRPLSR